MLLGQDAFSAQPFSTSPFLGNAVINVVGAPLTLSFGPVGIETTVINVVTSSDPLELKTAQFGTFTVVGTGIVPATNLKTPATGLRKGVLFFLKKVAEFMGFLDFRCLFFFKDILGGASLSSNDGYCCIP